MKQRPILFSTEMVQAILAGGKTQTRRVIKHKERGIISGSFHLGYMLTYDHTALLNGPDYPDGPEDEVKCPYGKPGDILWVRESFKDGHSSAEKYRYKASYTNQKAIKQLGLKFRPSIHMPKDAARIWLRVNSVNVQMLQDITDKDAIEEGALFSNPSSKANWGQGFARACFRNLWENINGTDSWQLNPWVWVVDFEVLSTTGKPDCITE